MTRRTIAEMLADARARLERVTAEQAHEAVTSGAASLIDVRTSANRERDGHIPGAIEIALTVLEWRLDPAAPRCLPDAPGLDDVVIVICDEGYSSSLAAARLQELGFARATDVIHGVSAWLAAGLPITASVADAIISLEEPRPIR